MLFFTLMHRMEDCLPLCASTSKDLIPNQDTWRRHQQEVVKRVCETRDIPRRMTVDQGQYSHHILASNGVVYSTFCQKGDSLAASYAFLEEIASEFQQLYNDQVRSETRPYKFIRFDSFISKSSKVYHTPGNARAAPSDVVRRTYNQVMGIVEEKEDNDMTFIYVFGGISVAALLLVIFLVYYLMA